MSAPARLPARLSRAWARAIVPRVPTVLFSLLLLAMMAVSIIAGRQLRRSRESHARATDEALTEYALFAARLFGERAFAVSVSERTRAAAAVLTAPQRPPTTVTLVDFAATVRDVLDGDGYDVGGDSLAGYFRMSARPGAPFEALGSARRADVRAQVDSALADVEPPRLYRNETAQRHRMLNGVPITVVIAMHRDADGSVITWFGYIFDRLRHWEVSGNRILAQQPLLPPSLLDPSWRYGAAYSTDSLISITAFTPQGKELYRSRRVIPGGISGTFEYRTTAGGVRFVATLHPLLVQTVRERLRANQRNVIAFAWELGGREHRVEAPIELLLPTLTALLAIAAVLHLWREHTLVRARRDFVASVSHELRTPLAQIRMFTETLQLGRERDAHERQGWLNIISREARRLGDLVENILLFSHIDADRARLELERTDLGELIEEVVEGYVPMADQRRMRILADAPSRIFSMVDPRAMRQVIVNLLDNALKYGPPGQTVSVELERIGSVARITVSDQGPGIESNDRKRLWEPFVRLGKEAGTSGGSGIGLAVVRALVEKHGATVALDDAPGGGARFILEFEVSESAAGLPLRATGEFRAPRMVNGVMISGAMPAMPRPGRDVDAAAESPSPGRSAGAGD
ncbi:MAG: HAMP domain-containing histidine kinase [Gemmatimonadaceae bacterium]|nr:HAMP domain-containing histidine kinase [Gemmatimonadaceae bacterium]